MSHYLIKVTRRVRWVSWPRDGGRYDLTRACPKCGTGAIRVDPIFAVPSDCKRGVFTTDKVQVLVSKDIFARFSDAGIGGLRQVVTRNGRDPLEFWSLEPQTNLPPWSAESKGYAVENQCPDCRRDGFFDIPKIFPALVYHDMPDGDLMATWEHFGNSRLRSPFAESVLAAPRLIVSERVRRILAEYRGVAFYEVASHV